MKKVLKKAVLIVLSLIMLVSCFTAPLGMAFAAKSNEETTVTKPALVESVIKYRVNYKTGKWEKEKKTRFEYSKMYPTLIKEYEYDSKMSAKTTLKYTFFENNNPKVRKEYKDGKLNWVVKYHKNGTINRMDRKGETVVDEKIFQYANGAPYFTMVLHNSIFYNDSKKKAVDFTMEEVDSIAVTTRENGLLKKTTNTGLYANWNEGEKKIWTRFNGVYTANYDVNGIVSWTSAKFKFGPSGKQLKFIATVKDGRVVQVVKQSMGVDESGNSKWVNESKYVFTYTDQKIDNARYSLMINDILLTSGSTYYIYNWY
ncbi:MAG: hypothetical protein IKN72_01985 [Clostridia bacterium]|nr:hypothetical protein [Clostridia bacterium]